MQHTLGDQRPVGQRGAVCEESTEVCVSQQRRPGPRFTQLVPQHAYGIERLLAWLGFAAMKRVAMSAMLASQFLRSSR